MSTVASTDPSNRATPWLRYVALCSPAIGDELLRALAAKGGVIQINALPIAVKHAPGNRQTEEGAALLERSVGEVLAVEAEQVEDHQRRRHLAHEPGDLLPERCRQSVIFGPHRRSCGGP